MRELGVEEAMAQIQEREDSPDQAQGG
jgi:hypothetical protein